MNAAFWGALGSFFLIIIGAWKFFRGKAEYRKQQAEQARKDLDDANKDNDPGKLLDAFGRMR